jgi:hypothetical protein
VALRVCCDLCVSVGWRSLGCGSFEHWNVCASVGWRILGCGSLAVNACRGGFLHNQCGEQRLIVSHVAINTHNVDHVASVGCDRLVLCHCRPMEQPEDKEDY